MFLHILSPKPHTFLAAILPFLLNSLMSLQLSYLFKVKPRLKFLHLFYLLFIPFPYFYFLSFSLITYQYLSFSVHSSNFFSSKNLLKLPILSCKASLFFVNRTISSAYARFQIFCLSIPIPPIPLPLNFSSKSTMYKLKRSELITHPCLMPLFLQNFQYFLASF